MATGLLCRECWSDDVDSWIGLRWTDWEFWEGSWDLAAAERADLCWEWFEWCECFNWEWFEWRGFESVEEGAFEAGALE